MTMSPEAEVIETALSGIDLINDPILNKGTAFTESERTEFALHGLLPPHVSTLEVQAARRLKAVRAFATNFQRYAFLRELQDTTETLYHALLIEHIEELLPLVYTPTVGEGCQRFSEIWRKPRGLFLSFTNKERISTILSYPRYQNVRAIVVSDGERILGLGDQGAGGMGIPIGKLALYTACGGIHPAKTLPILLDVGTDNERLQNDPMYVGWRHERVRGAAYDEFIEAFVTAVIEHWPRVLLQWEDFAGNNAARLLERYRDRLCTFNDDIQGTAAAAAGALLAAIHVTGVRLTEQRIVLFGAGSAGCGISALLLRAMIDAGLSADEARRRFYAVDRNGLLVEGMPDLVGMQRPLAQPRAAIAEWKIAGKIGLPDVVANARPTTLIGTSGQQGGFTEEVVRTMARLVERPVIFPLSNPTSRSEATPEDLVKWTNGRAVIGAGSPFPPIRRDGELVPVDQINNIYVFPGVALGILSAGARRVTDSMFMAAAKALAGLSPLRMGKGRRLLPPVSNIRSVSTVIATAVGREAQAAGVAEPCDSGTLAARIRANVWEPVYRPYRLVSR